MCFLPLKSSHYPSRPVPVPELFGKYPTRPVPMSKTPTRQTLVTMKRNIKRFPSKQMYPYLSLVERKVAEFYHNIDRKR